MAIVPLLYTQDTVNGSARVREHDMHRLTDTERAAGIEPTNYAYTVGLSRRHGTLADGVTNDSAALARGDTAGDLTIMPGTHSIQDDLTLGNRTTFQPGAILKPASGKTITFAKMPTANISDQIFDLSSGGSVAWPVYDRGPIHAAWFGAIPAADGTKNDQHIPINQAISSLGTRGGIIQLLGGDYYCTNTINIAENTIIRGTGHQGTGIRVSSSWGASTSLILFKNGTSAQFGCRLEDLNVSGNGNATVTTLINAQSWNESCGFRDVWVRDFMKYGLQLSNYYGGAATAEIQGVQFFVDSTATDNTQIGLQLVDPGYTQGWFQLLVRHTVFAGNSTNGQTKFTGISADGRVKIVAQGIHGEFCRTVVALSGAASCVGSSVQGGGAGDVTNVFEVASSWTGSIHVSGARIGGSTKMVQDQRASPASLMTIGNSEPYGEPLIYPPDPARAIAGGRFVGTASPSITYARGISGIARQASGQFRFTLSPALGDASLYDVVAQVYHSATLATRVVNNSGTTFDVFFTDMANAAADPDAIGIKVYHRAGGSAT
jgi:hypothetical protein